MKPALLYVVILLLLLRLQPQPVANGCCDAFCAVLCRGTDLSAAITSTTTVTTTTVTTTNRSTTTTTITTIEMPQRLIPNGSNGTPVYPAAAGTPSVTNVFPVSLPAESGLPAPDPDTRPTPLATEKSSPLPLPCSSIPTSSLATTKESSPLPPPGRSIQREFLKDVRRYLNATSCRKLDQSFVILIVDPKYFLGF
nr:PREDICTED: mucin-2-like [Musa acuminata subsp. malaccensis]